MENFAITIGRYGCDFLTEIGATYNIARDDGCPINPIPIGYFVIAFVAAAVLVTVKVR